MKHNGVMAMIRRYLLSGLLVWLPIVVTLLVLKFLMGLMDGIFELLPHAAQPDNLLGFHIPGLGLIFTLLILFFTGMLAANFFGKKLMNLWERLIQRIPLVRSLYLGVQQTIKTLFNPKGKAFRKVLLVEYPRKGMWSIAFLTSDACEEVSQKTNQEMITIFIPTTPNPTSGFLMMVPKEEVKELDMTVEQGLKMVISLGVVKPGMVQKEQAEIEEAINL